MRLLVAASNESRTASLDVRFAPVPSPKPILPFGYITRGCRECVFGIYAEFGVHMALDEPFGLPSVKFRFGFSVDLCPGYTFGLYVSGLFPSSVSESVWSGRHGIQLPTPKPILPFGHITRGYGEIPHF